MRRALCTSSTEKHPSSPFICDAMYLSGTPALYFLPPKTTMNGSRYFNLLREKLKFHIRILRCSIFIHAGFPCPWSRDVRNFQTTYWIQVHDCSDISKNVNLIENTWWNSKNKVEEKQSSSAMELVQVTINVWCTEIS